MADTSWMESARCAGTDTEMFYPPQGGRPSAYALALCRGCPVRRECRDYAREMESPTYAHGIWGGLTATQRWSGVRRERRHGTYLYSLGCRCPVCVAAKSEVERRYRERRTG